MCNIENVRSIAVASCIIWIIGLTKYLLGIFCRIYTLGSNFYLTPASTALDQSTNLKKAVALWINQMKAPLTAALQNW